MKTRLLQFIEQKLGTRFAANIAKLLSGAILSMVIGFMATPVLSRYYTPEEFGFYGLITSMVGTFAGISAFRYGMAIVLPKDEEDGVNLLALSLIAVGITGVLTSLLFIGGGEFIAFYYEKPELLKWLWAVPLLIVLTGTYESLRNWSTRGKYFGAMSGILVGAALVSASSKIIAGSKNYNHSGLIVGQLLGQIAGTVLMLAFVWKVGILKKIRYLSFERILSLAQKYIDFPRYNVPLTLLNASAKNLPVFGIGFFFSNSVVGLYSMAFLLLKAPAFLVSNALRQVFYQRASEIFHEQGDLYGETMKLTKIAFAIAIVPAIVFGVFSTPLLSTFLGPNWKEVGLYASILTPYFLMMFVATPSVAIFPIINMQRWILIWQIFSFAGTLIAIGIGGYIGDPVLTITLFSMAGTLLQVILIAVMTYITKNPKIWQNSYKK